MVENNAPTAGSVHGFPCITSFGRFPHDAATIRSSARASREVLEHLKPRFLTLQTTKLNRSFWVWFLQKVCGLRGVEGSRILAGWLSRLSVER